jgi:CubicO group peptidase (beta-lactamase class C family)
MLSWLMSSVPPVAHNDRAPINSLPRGEASMKRILIYLLFGSILAAGTLGRSQESTDRKVDAMFSDLSKPGSQGCAVGIYRDGKIVYAKGYGFANLEEAFQSLHRPYLMWAPYQNSSPQQAFSCWKNREN